MQLSCRILDAQQKLQAYRGGVLSYSSSLSATVHNALFSYWRLPLAVRQQLDASLPTIVLHSSTDDDAPSSISIDWTQLAECIQRSKEEGGVAGSDVTANPMETTWAFVLQAESLVTIALANDTEGLKFPAITHRDQLNNLLKLLHDDTGEFYMSFVVLITILERALYDLYHQSCEGSEPVALPTAKKLKSSPSAKKRKKNMILRDLLHSETLARVLPEGMLLLLKVLFLPSGLNLRNLVWHGFVIPAEFPKCFSCLMVVLLLALPQTKSDSSLEVGEVGDPLFNLHSSNDRFVLHDTRLRDQLDTLFGGKDQLMNLLSDTGNAGYESTFVPRGRRILVQKALRALAEDRDELWFLFALLPVLEHAMRIKFIATNRAKYGISSEYGTAQIDAYYSTLDGFGQKDKHQVLLHSHVVLEKDDGDEGEDTWKTESSGPHLNELYTSLPSAALAVCLDLFMMASGPNLRAKLCHGEADLSTLLNSKSASLLVAPLPISMASQLVLLTWLSLCQNEDARGKQSVEPLNRQPLVVRAFERSYSSSFHPFYQLQRALTSAFAFGKKFAELRSRFTRFSLDPVTNSDLEPMVWVEFPGISGSLSMAGDTKFGVLEKASRIQEFYGLLETWRSVFSWNVTEFQSTETILTPPPPLQAKTQSKRFPALLEQLYTKVSATLAQLNHHFQASHDTSSNKSAFIELLRATTGGDRNTGDHIFDGATPLERHLEARLLALSDDDGLSVASCMMEVVASAQRSYSSFQSRLLELQQLIVEGKARTNHRRSFLNSVFFLPVFEFVQVLCLSLVEHQVLHCLSLAAENSSSLSTNITKEENPRRALCPQARKFELLQRKLLQFITAFEGCAGGSSEVVASQKSSEKALLLALQFLDSKAIKSIQSFRS